MTETAGSSRACPRHRRPGTHCLTATAVLMLSVLLQPAASAQVVAMNGPTVGCVDPKVTTLLTDRAGYERHGGRGRARVRRRGRCFTIQPGERWERIYGVGSLVIMRRTPPEPGMPPLYFRSTAMRGNGVPDALPGAPSGGVPQTAVPADPMQIRVEDLPPASPAPPAATALAPPAPAGPVLPKPDRSVTARRSYAVGFVIAILLVTLLLAASVLLLLVLLRRSPDRVLQPPQPDLLPEPTPPMLRDVLLGVSGRKLRTDHEPAPDPGAILRRAASGLLRPLGMPSISAWPPGDDADDRHFCAMLLRGFGWQTSIRPATDRRHVNMVAQRGGRLMVLHCFPPTQPVDERAVEEACMAREREQADRVVIVSNAGCTSGVRQLAASIGVDLLHADELHAFAA